MADIVSGSSPAPRRILSTRDGVVLVVGLVVGAGIFRTPPLVAAQTNAAWSFLLLWLVGGAIALVGALCYAELASAHPHAGGEYHVLRHTFGRGVGFLVGWSRLAVLQTGSIALLAFVFADYAVSLAGSATSAPTLVPTIAALTIVGLTAVNAAGLRPGQRTQYLLTGAVVLGLAGVTAAGLGAGLGSSGLDIATAASTGGAAAPASGAGLALALVFVLLTYGGWSEAAYLSAELRDPRRGVTRTLTWGVAAVTLLYLLANGAYVLALGMEGVRTATAPAVDVVRLVAGEPGAVIVALVVMAAALSSANATMITGARGNFAVGEDVRLLSPLGVWQPTGRDDSGTPRRALVVQAAVSLLLVAFGAATRAGFESMVAYTAPVFWLTLLLMGVALLVLRAREPDRPRPFCVPLYPLTPLLFCATSAAMLYSSIAYAGVGALLGLGVMAAGVPLLLLGDARARRLTARDASVNATP